MSEYDNYPPQSPGEFDDGPLISESKWPKGFGITSIVFGALGLICFGCGSINLILTPMLSNLSPQSPAGPSGAQLAMQAASTLLSFCLSIWLLIAGIGLVRFKPWSVRNHQLWALVKIVIVVLGTCLSYLFAEESVRQVNDQLSQQGQVTPPFTMSVEIMYIVLSVSLVWFLVYPVILLLFMSRNKIREEIQTWEAVERDLV